MNITVPADYSAVAIVGSQRNRIEDGDDFRSDGWVYNKGVRRRKWFQPLGSMHYFWEPKIENLALLEAKRWKMLQYRDKINKPLWAKLMAKLKTAKKFGGYVDFGPGKSSGCVELTYYEEDAGVSWDWVKKAKPVKQGLVDEYFAAEAIMNRNNARHSMFKLAFERSVHHHYYNKIKRNGLKLPNFHLMVNGRDYWYNNKLEPIAYPEDVHHLVVNHA